VAASPRGTAPLGAIATERFEDVPLVVDPGGGPGLVALLPGLQDVQLERVEARSLEVGALVIRATAWRTDTEWCTELTAVNTNLDNGGALALADRTGTASGTTYPWPLVRLAGLALGAYGVPITTVRLDVMYTTAAPRGRWSPLQFGWFVDDTIDTLPDLAETLDNLRIIFQTQRLAVLGVGPSGEVLAYECAFAGVAADRLVWLRPGDVGNNVWQIPAGAINNSPQHYAFFPSVFVRRIDYQRDLYAAGPVEAAAITTLAGALPLVQVNRAPTHSRWIFIIDGVPRDVILAHPVGSDLRKPIEIWNTVIAPSLSNATQLATHSAEVTGALRTFPQTGILSSSSYLDAAIFLEPLDGNAEVSIYTQVAQV